MEIQDQPDPIKNDQPHIADLVIADMVERKAIGIERYKTALQPFNGRDALIDAYQEALDLTMYLRQAIEERAQVGKPDWRVIADEAYSLISGAVRGERVIVWEATYRAAVASESGNSAIGQDVDATAR